MFNSYSLDSPGGSFANNKPPQHSTSFSKNSALTSSPASLSDELSVVAKMLSTLANSFEVEQYDQNTPRTTPRQAALGDHLGRQSQPQSRGESPNNTSQNNPHQVGSLFGVGPSIPLISLAKRITGIHSKVAALQQACEHMASTAAAPSSASYRAGGGGMLESSMSQSVGGGGPLSRNGNSTQHLLHNNTNGDMVPQPPRLPPPQASVTSNTFLRGAGSGSASAMLAPTPSAVPVSGGGVPSPSSPRLKLTKPSSERVKQLPRATVPEALLRDTSALKKADKLREQGGSAGGDAAVNGIFNPNFKELQKVMTSTLYNVVESVVRTCQADRGYITTRQISKSTMSVADAAAIFSRNTSGGQPSTTKTASGGGDAEMVSIVNVEAALRFPPSLHRHQVEGSLAAGVLATGIALHQRAVPYPPGDPAELRYKNSPSSHIPITSNVLMFPIRRPPAVGDTWGSSKGDIIAVLVVENKHGGSTPFTPVDENLCNMTTQLLGEIMTRMPESVLDWSAHYYDPIGLHVVQPFVPFSKSLLRRRTTTTGSNAANDGTFLTSIGAQSGDAALGTMGRMAPHVPEQVIRRATVQPSSSKVRRNLNEGGGKTSTTSATTASVPKASGGDVSSYFSQLKEQRALLAKVGEGNLVDMSALITSKHNNNSNNNTSSSIEAPSKADQHELEFSSSNAGGVIAGLGPAPTLREMDSFLTNLTDCWQRSVQSCVEQQAAKKQQEREAKLVREQLLQAKKYIQKLEAEMRLHRLNADDYREEYRGLHEELEAFLKTKTSGSDDP